MSTLATVLAIFYDNFLLSLVSVLAIAYWYGVRNHDYWTKRGVKGPKPVPFLGNMFSLTTPIPTLYRGYLKQYGKFFGCFQGQKPHLFISDPEIIKRILVRDFNNFRNRVSSGSRNKIISQNLVAARDEAWKRIRSIVSPTFTNSKLKKMEQLMRECSESLNQALDKVAATSGQFVAHDLMGNFTMDVIAKCAFATDTEANKNKENVFVRHAKALFEFNLAKTLVLFSFPTILLRFLNGLKLPFFYNPSTDFFLNTGRHLVEERRKNNTTDKEDMLQLMVNAQHQKEVQEEKDDEFDARHVNQGKEELEQEKKLLKNISGEKFLSEEEILAQLFVFFLAGYETTASTLSYCLYSLSTTPEVQEKLYREVAEAKQQDPLLGYQTVTKLPYMDAVLAETLRKFPPAMTINREAMQEYHIPEYNYTVEKGGAITIPITAIHWSEELWEKPERFDPERFMPENEDKLIPYSYLPFGGGPRNCVGMRFAMAEAKLALAQLIDRYQFHRVNNTPNKLDPLLTVTLFKTHPINVGIKQRN